MDRPLDPRKRRQIRRRRLLYGVQGLAALVWLVLMVPGWVRPRVERERMRTAFVERGPLEATPTASGTVVPAPEPRSMRVMTAHVQQSTYNS